MPYVTSTITGGSRYSVAEEQYFYAAARTLVDRADRLAAAATAWGRAQITVSSQRSRLQWCAAANPSASPLPSPNIAADASGQTLAATAAMSHVSLDLPSLVSVCGRLAADLRRDASQLRSLADKLIRAHGLYADAESANRRVITELVELFARRHPLPALALTGVFAVGGLVYGMVNEGGINMVHALNATTWAQEGLMSGVGSLVTKAPLLGAVGATDEVNMGAAAIGHISATIKNLWQGDALTVRQVTPSREVVGSTSSISGALSDLHSLGTARLRGEDDAGLEYGTIAISQYRKDDGTDAWLVTIPGTDGKRDSPFGWEQNVELMSASAEQRKRADSARMVREAMERAGVRPGDHVSLIGHSQGGIVAAAIAADAQDTYVVDHVVTAGSPIANHPIPERTWVTSIEMEDELVAALDGAANPAIPTWLTVRGSLTTSDDELANGVEVATTSDRYEITHWLEYHQAAYEDATRLGNKGVGEHEEHFRHSIDGTYMGTTYWQGRMGGRERPAYE